MPYSTFTTVNHATSSNGHEYLANAKEFVKDKLYLTSLSHPPPQYPHLHFFTIDNQLIYINFYSDFGPNNIAHVLRFCSMVEEKLRNTATSNKKICLYSSLENDKRANAAFLMCAYMVIVHKKTPEEAYQPLVGLTPPFMPYRDAGYGAATYHITVLDCIRGLYKVLVLGLLDLENFNLEQYEFYEKVENGDFNWITKKFLALANPKEEFPPGHMMMGRLFRESPARHDSQQKLYSCYQIDNLIKFMLENNIKTIVRLNNKTYERKRFLDAGIEHIDLYFPDGTTPPDGILKRFLEICETREGPIAVHCKAGLGRTGTLIASFLMKHYKLTASEVISFLRVIRPGSVVGPQQNYLQAMQARLWKLHPIVKLPPQISCWSPPTFAVSTESHYAMTSVHPFAHPLMSHQSSEKKTVKMTDNDEMDVQSRLENGSFGPTQLTSEYDHHSIGKETGFEALFIPIQPRKNFTHQEEQNWSRQMDQNGVKPAMNAKYGLTNQAPISYTGVTGSRYHLRSTGAAPPGLVGNTFAKMKTGGSVEPELVLIGGKISSEKDQQALRK